MAYLIMYLKVILAIILLNNIKNNTNVFINY